MRRALAHLGRLEQGGRSRPTFRIAFRNLKHLISGVALVKMLDTYLPSFTGFYGTHWEDLLSQSEDNDA
ncbi:hypothetical protein V1281_005162 [Nitrobacteraceae bacterium AZCC 2161]